MGELTVKELFGYFWNFGLPITMFSIWSYAGYKGWWVWRRELDTSVSTCGEWKTIAMRSLGYAETTAAVAQKVLDKP